MSDELNDYCMEYLEYELRASESLRNALEKNDANEIVEGFKETATELIRKFDDPSRKKTVLISTFRVGEAMGSQELVQFANNSLEEWESTYNEQ